MAGGRLRNAMADMAETIRRVFQDPPAHALDLGLRAPATRSVPFPATRALTPPLRLAPGLGSVPVFGPGTPVAVPFHWQAQLREEEGWASWAAGAQVCVLPLFQAERATRMEVPALPRKVRTRAEPPAQFRALGRAGLQALPGVRALAEPCLLPAPRSFRALEHALAQPVAFQGEDIPKISKTLWMRYTLKLVRETGENIRNLEVLGLYRIPVRGSRQINHQPATGRLLVSLGSEAAGAPKAPFILARKKDDDSIVCCFVEDV